MLFSLDASEEKPYRGGNKEEWYDCGSEDR